MSQNGEQRPDPDALLALARQEERAKRRGRLRIFFGAAPGVGKTYSMLEEAYTKRAEGLDVVAGVVETHGRGETEALLTGLEVLPRKAVDYRGHSLQEFDLDAALARHPALLLVDELAHTNAPGCRHAKRWQDVRELLERGIDVYTTVNVQHVESLNDVVAQITGVRVRETVPDALLEEADALVIVDLTPDDLLQRLKEGKVYIPRQAEWAGQHFFRPANLTALRELSLRLTAERVNTQVLIHRQGQAGAATWPTSERIVVCVGPSPSSAKLVRAAKRMASGLHAPWIAVSVQRPQVSQTEDPDDHMAQSLQLAESLGAEVVTLTGRHVAEEIVSLARQRNATRIIIGKPLRPRWKDFVLGSPVDELVRLSGDIDVHVIRGDGEPPAGEAPAAEPRAVAWNEYGLSLAVWGLCTVLAFVMRSHFQLSNLIMVYLLGVVVVALRCGRGPSVFASVAGVLTFDFFFVPPQFTLAVSDTQYFVTFAVMLVVALVISHLAALTREQVRLARASERRMAAMHELSRQLASTRGAGKLLETAVRHISEIFEARAAALVPAPGGGMNVAAASDPSFQTDAKGEYVARWVFDNGQPAGRGTQTLPETAALYLPMSGLQGPVGVLGLTPRFPERIIAPDQMRLMDSFARQTGLALEVDRLEAAAVRTHMEAETERLRSALLSAVTHDLQTPLAAILGSAGSLLELDPAQLPPETWRGLAETIYDETERLSRLLANLLKMTRLESGNLRLNKEPQPLEEVVGAAVNRLERKLGGRPLDIRLPADLPLVPLDSILAEQVFINLLENSIKHTPPGTPLSMAARAVGDEIEVSVADRGPGLPEGALDKVFDLFYRGPHEPASRGHGLGLAICRAVLQAHGGSITARNREGGGAEFLLRFPLNAPEA